MGVADLLGLDEGGELLDRARASWTAWAATDPRLRVVGDFDELKDWLASVSREESDRVLLALARLAAADGGDDPVAAGALAKCLLPGVCVTADRICRMVCDGRLRTNLNGPAGQVVDELAASQLWIEARSFPWRRLTRVASNVLVNVRHAVLADLGDNSRLWRYDKTWANTSVLQVLTFGNVETRTSDLRLAGVSLETITESLAVVDEDHSNLGVLERLLKVLAWGCEHEVISRFDRELLLVVAEEADRVETIRTCRRGGLLGNEISARIGPRLGVSGHTVRRRVAASMAALAASVPREVAEP
jgi:hypothetical protein